MNTIKHKYNGAILAQGKKSVAQLASENKTYLSRAYLSGADLSGADLSGAYLSGADLSRANLSGADLSGAENIPDITAAQLMACPEYGAFTAWKKCRGGVIVKLLIPESSKRSSATSRKCRAEFVEVIKVIGADFGISQHDPEVVYKAGETVRCDRWEENRWIDCGGGIHFFITRKEAEDYE